MMVTEIKASAHSRAMRIYRGAVRRELCVPKMRLEIVVPDNLADAAVETIAKRQKRKKSVTAKSCAGRKPSPARVHQRN
jgi:nitrogen regulatory protein P-II 1